MKNQMMNETQSQFTPSQFTPSQFTDDIKKFFSPENRQRNPTLLLAGLVTVLLYSYWNSLMVAAGSWNSPQYSHAWIVPIFTVAVLWLRRKPFVEATPSARWCGVSLVLLALTVRFGASYYRMNTPDSLSFIPALGGIFLLVGGWPTLKWSWAPIAFLVFMIPLNMTTERLLLHPMQRVATSASVYVLQTLGVPVFQDGNMIQGIDDLELNVIDQCSGLRMTTIFIALSIGIIMITGGEWWEKAIIVGSAIPIALVVNLVRITITGLLYVVAHTSDAFAHMVFHDLAGWLMMPMALGLLYLEIQILSRLFVVRQETRVPVRIRTARVGSLVGK